MEGNTILVGVDATAESARAAALGWAIARVTQLRFRLVHVVPDGVVEALAAGVPPDPQPLRRMHEDDARDRVEAALRKTVPAPVIRHLELHRGAVAETLAQLAGDARMLVLGGKHHSTLGRWLAGSTAHTLVRTTPVPLLIAGPANTGVPRRVLAALDLSTAAEPTLAYAARFAAMLEADLGAVHVVEPPVPIFDPLLGPAMATATVADDDRRYRLAEQVLDHVIWPKHVYPALDRMLRRGSPAATIEKESRDWHADLLVLSSHGRNFVERFLLGSVTSNLLTDLPASLLILPALEPVKSADLAGMPGALAWA